MFGLYSDLLATKETHSSEDVDAEIVESEAAEPTKHPSTQSVDTLSAGADVSTCVRKNNEWSQLSINKFVPTSMRRRQQQHSQHQSKAKMRRLNAPQPRTTAIDNPDPDQHLEARSGQSGGIHAKLALLVDPYDPTKPNSYDNYVEMREKDKRKEAMLLGEVTTDIRTVTTVDSIDSQAQQHVVKPGNDVNADSQAHAHTHVHVRSLRVSGEEAFRRRAALSRK